MKRASMPRPATLAALGLPALCSVAYAAEPTPRAPQVQTLPEFLDSLSDNALSSDRRQIYRVDGERRYVTLGAGWTAVLDERAAVRLGSTGSGPATAGPPGRALAVVNNADNTHSRLYVQDDSTGREVGAGVAWNFRPNWTLRTQAYRLRDNSSSILRSEAETALRYGPRELWVEGLLRHASLDDETDSQDWVDRKPSANFVGARALWQPMPTLSLTAQAQRAISPDLQPGDEDLGGHRTEVGADWRPQLHGPLSGLRLYWRQATQLGLLASDGVERRTTYRSVTGASVPDGSPDGSVYTELRRHSLTSDADALWVVGWRHSLVPAPQWRINTTLETAEPVGGDTAIRSHTVGVSVTQSAHPSHSLLAETEAVHTSLRHSSYVGLKLTDRFTDNSLTAWRLSITDDRPKPSLGGIGTTHLKASAGWGWREPQDKRLTTLWRYSLIARNAHGDDVVTPFVADRRAHIVFGHVGWDFSNRSDIVLRGSRRWDRDESFQAGALRSTTLWLMRASKDVDDHWVLSAHAATRSDSAGPRQTSTGLEVGYNLSRKVALAVGYNFRGFDDGELELDDKLKKGVTLRLRFSIETALARWLDPPMPGREAKPETVSLDLR